jgi:high-affinity Fe2+/Pb2+ permease
VKGASLLETLSSGAMAIAVIASFLLAVGGVRLMLDRQNRKRGALMLVAAAVLMANVLIWTL